MARAEGGPLRANDGPLIGRLRRLVLKLARRLESKNASLAQPRRLLFGPRSEKRLPSPVEASAESPPAAALHSFNQAMAFSTRINPAAPAAAARGSATGISD